MSHHLHDDAIDVAPSTRASIGVNMRVTGHCQQGGRKYMEDFVAVAYQQTEDEKDLEYAYFGIFDGHGGAEAAAFAKEHLMENIVKDERFWLDDDAAMLESIRDGFVETHHAMWRIHDKWPKTASGLPSTAGTTASVAFIRRGKIYVGHVGDSGITLGYQTPGDGSVQWQARSLTKDHKPECVEELARIERAGGKVVSKMGVPRVVWNRPRVGHKGPVRRSTPIDEIPFLAVARSLGDLWSYNNEADAFVVSPKPDVAVIPIDTNSFRCLIFGTDGLYNMLSAQMAVHVVQEAEIQNEAGAYHSPNMHWINPSRLLVDRALTRWCNTKMRADNTSVITLMLDPPGPPKAQVLKTENIETIETVEDNNIISSSTSSSNETDIQINEVTSSDEAAQQNKRKKKPSSPQTNQRKINLRSSNNEAGSGENRVLRERRNGPNTHPIVRKSKKLASKVRNTSNNFSTEKRRLLATLLFRNTKTVDEGASKASAKPKTKENLTMIRRSERMRVQEAISAPREMRQSTLDQQKSGGLLKAKLRNKLKRRAKSVQLNAA